MRAREEIAEVAAEQKCEISITAVAGGEDRISSVQTALKRERVADYVLVHDAARCLTPPDVFARVVAALRSGAEAVVPVLPMIDTVRQVVSDPAAGVRSNVDGASEGIVRAVSNGAQAVVRGNLDRAELRRVQTPQGFRAGVLRRAYAKFAAEGSGTAEGAGTIDDQGSTDGAHPTDGVGRVGSVLPTDDAGLVERLGVDIVAVDGDDEALKITYPLDLVLAEQLARMRDGAAVPGADTLDSAKEPR